MSPAAPVPAGLPPIKPDGRTAAGWILLSLAAILLTVWSFRPAEKVLDASLDGSNFGSYAYFTAHGFHFGRDVVAVTGPYGFVNYGFVYNGELFWTRFALELAVKGAFAALVLWFFCAAESKIWRWGWLAAIAVSAPLIEDTCYDLCILLGGIYLLIPRREGGRGAGLCAVAALLAFLSLCKGTQVFFALGTMGLVILHAIVRRDFRRCLIIVTAFGAAFVGFWLGAGQNPLDIPAFLRGVQETASGYNNAMGLDEPLTTTRFGLGVLITLVLAAVAAAWLGRRSLPHVLACIYFAGFAFTQWKHGFVRADGHVFIFFVFGISAALIPMMIVAGAPGSRAARIVAASAALAALAAGIAATSAHTSVPALVTALRTSIGPKLQQIFHPVATRAQLQAGLDFHRRKYGLPELSKKIGERTIDFFGSDHAFIPLNDLRYHPRPVGGGNFTVYTEYLKSLNETFLRDPSRRPDFYLIKTEILDDRLLTQEDSRSFPALLHLYRPVATERGLSLLEKIPAPVIPPPPRPVSSQAFHWDEAIKLPPQSSTDQELTLVSFELELNWLGRLRALFYKPPQVHLSVSGSGIVHGGNMRLIPAMFRSPVILSPLVEDTLDLLGLYTEADGKRVQDFRLTTDHPKLFQSDRLRVDFYRLPRPAVVPAAGEILALARFPASNLGAETMEPVSFPHYLEKFVVGFHAPSRAVFPLNGTERVVDLEFGVEPGAYSNGNATDGVVFNLDVQSSGGGRQTVFRRHLDPLRQNADRGDQSAHVALPPVSAGSKLVLAAEPGPNHDRAWDWSYVTKFIVERGAFHVDQFPGFNVAPVEVEGDGAGAVNIGERSVFMLNAPGRVTFVLSGREQQLSFSGGLMPGAYSEGGRSDGTAFVAELQQPDGSTRQIFYRLVNPRDKPAEAGLQTFTVTLPPHAAGSRLSLRTDAGPAGDRSWDWSYLCDVHLE